MRGVRSARLWVAALVLAVVAAPAALTCVVPRDLDRQVELAGDEVCVGTITNFHEVWADPGVGHDMVFTVVDFRVEESMVHKTGSFDSQFYFIGSVLPGSQTTTITPSPEHIQVGKRLLLFLNRNPFGQEQFGDDTLQLASYAESYPVVQVESQSQTRSIIVGKGEGFAFRNNVELNQARQAVYQALSNKKNAQDR